MKTNNKKNIVVEVPIKTYYSTLSLDFLDDLFMEKQWGIININFKVVNEIRTELINNKNKYKKKEFKERLDELDLEIHKYRLLCIRYGIY